MSYRPAKVLLRLWMKDIYKSSKDYGVGLDVACSDMRWFPYFKTKRYIGVDIDADSVRKGVSRYPEAMGLVCSIEDLFELGIEGDFVTCLQTLGMNRKFMKSKVTIERAVRNLVTSTRPEGMLVFNVGSRDYGEFNWVQDFLQKYFAVVRIRFYGAHNKFIESRLVAGYLALDMYHGRIPCVPLEGEKRCLYVAKFKRDLA
jgi:SAM-dependent methyltransferase